MRKLVIKTIVITLLGVIFAFCALYFVLAFTAPSALAKTAEKFGWKETAVKYYERQYEKTEEYSDLLKLCENIDEHKNFSLAKKYLKLLVESEKFFDAVKEDGGVEKYRKVSEYEFFIGKYVVALYLSEGITETSSFIAKEIKKGYSCYNPVYVLACDTELKLSSEAKTKLKSNVNSVKTSSSYSAVEKSYMNRDIQLLSESAE